MGEMGEMGESIVTDMSQRVRIVVRSSENLKPSPAQPVSPAPGGYPAEVFSSCPKRACLCVSA